MAKPPRKKKHDPSKLLRANSKMADDFIIYAVDGLSHGVKLKRTFQTVAINSAELRVLTQCKHRFKFVVGSVWRDADGKDFITYSLVETTNHCYGEELTPVIQRMATEHGEEIGQLNFLTTFYFATSDMNFEFDDVVVWQLLKLHDPWGALITWREYTINEAITMNKHIKSQDLDTTQVGGSYYSKLAIQPRHVIVPLQLPWDFGNAIKYVIRHADKNGSEDLRKAWDYVARMRAEGQSTFPQKRVLKRHDALFKSFIAQFDQDVQTVLDVMWEVYNMKFTDQAQFNEAMSAILFEINELHKKYYKLNAYGG
jgi:hypothetical protein